MTIHPLTLNSQIDMIKCNLQHLKQEILIHRIILEIKQKVLFKNKQKVLQLVVIKISQVQ